MTATFPLFSQVDAIQQTVVQTLVVFDSRVSDLPTLQAALLPGYKGAVVPEQVDALEFITVILEASGATDLAIVAHGEPGVIHLGVEPITLASLQWQAGALAQWGVNSIALYACEVGADADFVAQLGELTGAKVAAATGKVGAVALGGSWELVGAATQPLFDERVIADYKHVLIVQDIVINGDTNADRTITLSEAQNITVSGNITQNGNQGRDILLAIYSQSGNLLYWQSFVNSEGNGASYLIPLNLDTILEHCG